jgi:1-aminocyclopropane-1-carboxylate deaminase
MAIDLREDIQVESIAGEWFQRNQIELSILRLDQIHPMVSGNKWFKLKQNIEAALQAGKKSLLTFGGAYSNHLFATAAAAKAFGLQSIGMVRGLHGKDQSTQTLQQCAGMGMGLQFLSRETYAKKEESPYLEELQLLYPEAYIIPEGGDNELGVAGAEAIASCIPGDSNYVVLPVGTGTTFAGIRNGLNDSINMLGFPAMKGGMYLKEEIATKLRYPADNWQLNADNHFGGFAKYNAELLAFMNDFFALYQIPLDVVYTAKMMYGIFDLLRKDHFPTGSKILCIHTGGLQGNSAVSQYLHYS